MKNRKVKVYSSKNVIAGHHADGAVYYKREKTFLKEAVFLEFGLESGDIDTPGSYTVAIVEYDDGTLDTFNLWEIEFLKEDPIELPEPGPVVLIEDVWVTRKP